MSSGSASEMTYIVSSGALNSTHSLMSSGRRSCQPTWNKSLHYFN